MLRELASKIAVGICALPPNDEARISRPLAAHLHHPLQVLHYLGYDHDGGGIVSLVRALAATHRFDCLLGLNERAVQHRTPPLGALEFQPLAGERIGLRTLWRARAVARQAAAWLRADPRRVFHGHSRAGLCVALFLHRAGERRVVATVHCYGRQRWFYRWAARQLRERMVFLSPAMKRYYGCGDGSWDRCIPGAIFPTAVKPAVRVPGRLRLGGAGALVRWKRWELVVEALALLPQDQRGAVTFEHIGGGDAAYRAEMEARARALGVAAQVNFRGPESSSARLLGEIDALVVASHQEPFSISLLEALHAGVPAIVSDSGGSLDVVVPGVNGWSFADGDAASLAAAIGRARDGLPSGAARPDLTRFLAPTATEDYLALYRRLPDL